MKILLSFLQDQTLTAHPVAPYRFWTSSIKNGIIEAGMTFIEVADVGWAAGLVPYENTKELQAWKDETWSKTLAFIKENLDKIDVFLTYLYPKQIDVNAIKEIRKLGIPCVNFYCDHIREFTTIPKEFKVFDLMWVPEYEAIAMYEVANIKYANLPMPIWIDPKYRALPNERNNSISFIGTKDKLRTNLLAYAIEAGLPIEISGNGWIKENFYADEIINPKNLFQNKIINQIDFIKRFGAKGFLLKNLQKFEKTKQLEIPEKFIFDVLKYDDYILKTKESCITLGINRVPSFKKLNKNPLTYSKLRDLEATMLGACYLTEHTEGLKNLYDIGTEIETYCNEQELVIKSKELLSNPVKRKLLRENGQKRALTELAIPQTLIKIKSILFN